VLTQKTREMVNSILEREAGFLPYSERQMIAAVVSDEVLGLGPLEPLLNDNDITEIMVNGPKQIYVERQGRLELSETRFRDDEHVMHIIDKIVSPIWPAHRRKASPWWMQGCQTAHGSMPSYHR
jgi:pilus assembly protein CpaF